MLSWPGRQGQEVGEEKEREIFFFFGLFKKIVIEE